MAASRKDDRGKSEGRRVRRFLRRHAGGQLAIEDVALLTNYMNKPTAVSRALLVIWTTFGISAVLAVVDRMLGHLTPEAFLGTLILYMTLTVLPYKISQGRNWARYTYAVLAAFAAAMMVAGETAGATKIELVWAWVTLPLEAWIVYSLFTREANQWFHDSR